MNICIALLLTCLRLVHGFYLPGIAPTDYTDGQNVPLMVNSLTPGRNSLVSVDYYTPQFCFCPPKDGPKKQSESLGSILFGDRIFDSPFELYMLRNESCKFLCATSFEDLQMHVFAFKAILDEYDINWLIDGLPAASQFGTDPLTSEPEYRAGFRFGALSEENTPILHNHYDINVQYHALDGGYRVVGVIVTPSSRANLPPGAEGQISCDATERVTLTRIQQEGLVFTYSVIWTPSDTVWATRWDRFLHVYNPKIHWLSLMSSAVAATGVTAIVSGLLARGVHKDIQTYNEIDLAEDVLEDSGWKLLHGDVFRAPKKRMLLSILLGSGLQLLSMTSLTLVFSLLGLLSPSNSGSLATVLMVSYAAFGSVGGYVSARFYKTFDGEATIVNAVLTPVLVPGIIFGIFLCLNFFLVYSGFSGAVPFGTMLAVVAIWLLISVPLSAAGSFLGSRRADFTYPVKTKQIPRQVPPQPAYLGSFVSTLSTGILPFAAIFIELSYIYNCLWIHGFYYMYGFLFLGFILMVLTTFTVTMVQSYLLLRSENYNWQWRSFVGGGACSFYMFLYTLVYLTRSMSLGDATSYVLYLGYSSLLAFLVFVMTGSVGFIGSFFSREGFTER